MKKLLFCCMISFLALACKDTTGPKEATETTPAAAMEEKVDYAYVPFNHPPDNWDRGSQKNIAIVLNALKAFENGKIEESLAGFADSVHWSADGIDAKVSKDSLRALFTETWKNMASLKVQMDDYESVISKDKKEEWVTLWYKEIITDKQGKVDSMASVNDAKIENGKITALDEKTRKYPGKK